jgi:1-acyl-sn-glycerol-3-phosphate acyltransferase
MLLPRRADRRAAGSAYLGLDAGPAQPSRRSFERALPRACKIVAASGRVNGINASRVVTKDMTTPRSKGPAEPGFHARRRRVIRQLMRMFGPIFLVKIGEVRGLSRVPGAGPAIFVYNHIGLVDAATIIFLSTRDLTPLAWVGGTKVPVLGHILAQWGFIPVRNDVTDIESVRQSLALLKAEGAIVVAAESRRNPSMERARRGFAYLASRSKAPVIPVGLEGTDRFPSANPRRWLEPGVAVTFGEPLWPRTDLGHPTQDTLQAMADEAMYRVAHLLPEARRGVYAGPPPESLRYWLPAPPA